MRPLDREIAPCGPRRNRTSYEKEPAEYPRNCDRHLLRLRAPRTLSPLDLVTRAHYCENMKNITVSVDDDVYRQARVKAAQRDTSVSALVKRYLVDLARDEGTFERLAREEKELRARIRDFSAGDRLPRDELYERGR